MIKNLKEIIIFCLIVTAIVSAVWCFVWRQASVDERLLYEDTLFKETVLNKKAQEQLSRLQNEIGGLQKSINNLITKSDLLETELISGRQLLVQAQRNLTRLRGQNISAKRDIEKANLNINNLNNRIADIVKETLNVDNRLILLMKTKNALSQQIEQYEQKFPLKAPAASHEQDSAEVDLEPMTETILHEPLFADGEVLTVNREFAFLVINLGKSQGVEEGMILNIKRNDKSLARARIEAVREHISAAALLDKESLLHIRAGDKALVTGSM